MGTEGEGEKEKTKLTAPESEETGFPLCRTHMINKDDFNTIFENSIQFFMPPLSSSFLTLQRNKNQAIQKALTTCCDADLNEGSGTTYITLWFKVEIWRRPETNRDCDRPLWRLKDSQQDPGCQHKLPCMWAEQCDNHNNTHIDLVHSYWALKESSMLFFHTQFYLVQVTNTRDSSFWVVQCVYCDWKDFDNLERTMQCLSRCMQCFM